MNTSWPLPLYKILVCHKRLMKRSHFCTRYNNWDLYTAKLYFESLLPFTSNRQLHRPSLREHWPIWPYILQNFLKIFFIFALIFKAIKIFIQLFNLSFPASYETFGHTLWFLDQNEYRPTLTKYAILFLAYLKYNLTWRKTLIPD